MRVLVTGASGVFGTEVARRLARHGVDVVGLSRRPPGATGIDHVSGDIRDAEAVRRAMAGCDAVAHLAWAVTALHDPDETRAVNVGGTQNVLDAMGATGCRRIVFSSSVTAYGAWPDNPPALRETDPLRPDPTFLYGAHKAEAEALVAASGFPHVITRTASVAGRNVDNVGLRLFGGPVVTSIKGEAARWQFVHQDDVGRFHAEAVLSDRTGIFNVGADDVLSLDEVARLIGRRVVELPEPVVTRMTELGWRYHLTELDPGALAGMRYMPVADTTRLREEWGFECAWTGAEALADMGRVLSRVVFFGARRVERATRLPWADTRIDVAAAPARGGALVPAAPPGVAGELDDLVDPAYPTYTAANLSEAFPGPMTPLSLMVAARVLHAASDGQVPFLGLEGDLAEDFRARTPAIFGHRLWSNVSVLRRMAEVMPGWSPEDIDAQYLGIAAPEGPRPAPSTAERVATARAMARGLVKATAFPREVGALAAEVESITLTGESLAALTDARLEARVELLLDLVGQGWSLASTGAILAGAALTPVVNAAGAEYAAGIRGGLEPLLSAGAVAGVTRLARGAIADPKVGDILRAHAPRDALAWLRLETPAFAAAFDAVVADCAHRGPGETELENPTFGDDPTLLLDAVAKSLAAPGRIASAGAVTATSTAQPLKVRVLTGRVHQAMRSRERARDLTMRLTHELRLAVRERARRLVASGAITDAADVFYLTFDELLDPPAGVAARVPDRRAERDRLAGIRMPGLFTLTWEPELAGPVALAAGESLTGIAAVPGTARGRVRVLRDASTDLEPGEVLVARVTDVGWTPLFAYAAAVVTDIGGLASHAAVVARELGIPCIVGADGATTRLVDGTTVDVDGTTGTITVVA